MRGRERRAARRYVHRGPAHWTCSAFRGRFHGCLRCHWRDLTGQTRRARLRAVAEMRERKARTPLTVDSRWRR